MSIVVTICRIKNVTGSSQNYLFELSTTGRQERTRTVSAIDPTWNEKFVFSQNDEVILRLCDENYAKTGAIGACRLLLRNINPGTTGHWAVLTNSAGLAVGEVQVAFDFGSGSSGFSYSSTSTTSSVVMSKPESITIKVIEAHSLSEADKRDKCDPYVQLKVGSTVHRTSSKFNSKEPVFNETFAFLFSPEDSLEVLVKDDDVAREDLGKAIVTATTLWRRKGTDFWILLQNAHGQPSGRLHLGINSGGVEIPTPAIRPNVTENVTGALVARTGDPLIVQVVCAEKLPVGNFRTYVEIKIAGQTRKTTYKESNANPVWEEDFLFSAAPTEETLYVKILDKNSVRDDYVGQGAVPVHELFHIARIRKHLEIEMTDSNGRPAGLLIIGASIPLPTHLSGTGAQSVTTIRHTVNESPVAAPTTISYITSAPIVKQESLIVENPPSLTGYYNTTTLDGRVIQTQDSPPRSIYTTETTRAAFPSAAEALRARPYYTTTVTEVVGNPVVENRIPQTIQSTQSSHTISEPIIRNQPYFPSDVTTSTYIQQPIRDTIVYGQASVDRSVIGSNLDDKVVPLPSGRVVYETLPGRVIVGEEGSYVKARGYPLARPPQVLPRTIAKAYPIRRETDIYAQPEVTRVQASQYVKPDVQVRQESIRSYAPSEVSQYSQPIRQYVTKEVIRTQTAEAPKYYESQHISAPIASHTFVPESGKPVQYTDIIRPQPQYATTSGQVQYVESGRVKAQFGIDSIAPEVRTGTVQYIESGRVISQFGIDKVAPDVVSRTSQIQYADALPSEISQRSSQVQYVEGGRVKAQYDIDTLTGKQTIDGGRISSQYTTAESGVSYGRVIQSAVPTRVLGGQVPPVSTGPIYTEETTSSNGVRYVEASGLLSKNPRRFVADAQGDPVLDNAGAAYRRQI